MIKTHPWQNGPAEIISYALELIHDKHNKEFNNRIAFLLLDIGVETLFKTFLTLPEDVTHADTEYRERRKAANGTFHDLVVGIKAAAPSRLKDDILSHIEFYHDLRNKLYHQGNGITIPVQNVLGYAKDATYLLKSLIGVDLTEKTVLAPDSLKKLTNQATDLESALIRLRETVNLVIEKKEPKLLLPSTVNKLHDISVDVDIENFEDKLDAFNEIIESSVSNKEIQKWVLDLIEPYLSGASTQAIANAKFLFDMVADPTSFYLLIIGSFILTDSNIDKEYLYSSEDLTIVDDQEYHIAGLYSSAKFYQEWASARSINMEQSMINNIIEQCIKLLQKIEKLNDSLCNWINNN